MTDPTEALVRREVTRARQILREDKVLGKLHKAFPDEEPPPDDKDGPKPPDPAPPKEQPKKKGVWWGEEHDA